MLEEHGEALRELSLLEELEEARRTQPSSAGLAVDQAAGSLITTGTSTKSLVQAGLAGVSLGVRDFEKGMTQLLKVGKKVAGTCTKACGIVLSGVGMILNFTAMYNGIMRAWAGHSRQADCLQQLAEVYLKLGLKMKGYLGGWPDLDAFKGLRPEELKMQRLKVKHFERRKNLTMPLPKFFELSLELPNGRCVRSPPWRRGTPAVSLDFQMPVMLGPKPKDMLLEVYGYTSSCVAWTHIPFGQRRSDPDSYIDFELEDLADFH